MNNSKLARRQAHSKVEKIRVALNSSRGVPSWIRYLRQALGMTVAQLSQRSNLATPTIYQLERKETEGAITLKKLQQIAEALDADFCYALIPRKPIQQMVHEQALKKATAIIQQSHLQMEYEDQAVDQKQLKTQLEDLVETLKSDNSLWDHE